MLTLDQILEANTPQELFGNDKNKAERTYMRLLHVAHPDMYGDDNQKKIANDAFIHLNMMWERFQNRINPATATASQKMKTKKHEFILGDFVANHDGFSLFTATYDAGHEHCYMVIPQSAADNDLNENATDALKKLQKEIPTQFHAFYPWHAESFKFTINGEIKQLVAYHQPENLFSLRQVLEDYPEGIHAKDVAWMFRRLLVAIGNAHDIGLIHGAVNLDTVLIEPDQHGLVLAGWEYSTVPDEPLVAVPATYRSIYPKYVFEKKPVTYALDIHLAAKTMEQLLREDAPKPLRAFFKGCQLVSVPKAAKLLADFDELLERMYGARKFHKFEMKRTQKE